MNLKEEIENLTRDIHGYQMVSADYVELLAIAYAGHKLEEFKAKIESLKLRLVKEKQDLEDAYDPNGEPVSRFEILVRRDHIDAQLEILEECN